MEPTIGCGVFIVGTDTGVGKTTVSLALINALGRDHSVAAFKPCETGNGDDAARLRAASSIPATLEEVNPYRFALPAAPALAARAEGREVQLGPIIAAYRKLASRAQLVIAEGAGGLLVPFTDSQTTVELIAALDLPILIVARTALGTINHSLLTIEVARQRGLRVLGVIFSRHGATVDPQEQEVIDTICRFGQTRCFGVLPWLGDPVEERALAGAARAHLGVDALLPLIRN